MDGFYGNPWQTDGLNNQQVGPSVILADVRDRCRHTGTLTSIDLFRKTGAGYSLGTGGSWTVRCETDAAGLASGTLIAAGAAVTVATPTSDLLQRFTFATPINDVLGTLRHFTVANADGSPAANFVSLNCMDLSGMGTPTPLQPTMADADRAYLSSTGAGLVIDRNRYPLFALNYADGTVIGVSYGDALSGSGQREIGSGGRMVRMNFTPVVNQLVVRNRARVYKPNASTAAALSVKLRNLTAGTIMDQTTFAPGAVNTGSTVSGYGAKYVDWTLFAAALLVAGTNYSLELSSSEVTNPYVAFPSRVGGAGFLASFAGDDRFLDGWWEYTTDGVTWLTHPVGTTEQQMQMFFDLSTGGAQRKVAGWTVRSGGS